MNEDMEHFLIPFPASDKHNYYFDFYPHRLDLAVLENHKNEVLEYVLLCLIFLI